MEDVLEVYKRPYDPRRPVVCLDETSKQMVAETRVPIPARPGQKARHDYEYERKGVANLFMIFAPLEGWRHVKVTDHHAAIDYAQVLKIDNVNQDSASKILNDLGIDQAGFDDLDRKVLKLILESFGGGPVGIESLAASLNEEVDTLEDAVEPYLLMAGYLKRTSRGRLATRKAFEHFGLKFNQEEQEEIF